MVIKAENTSFKNDYSVSGDDEKAKAGAPSRKEMGLYDEPTQASPVQAVPDLPEGIEPGSLDELQFAMNTVANYAGKGTPEGASTLSTTLLKAAGALSVEVTERELGAALAAVVLLADEAGFSIDVIANKKLTGMVTK